VDPFELEAAMTSEQVVYAVLDEHAKALHVAADDDGFFTFTPFPSAVACALGAGPAPISALLLHQRHDIPVPLIREVVTRGWPVEPHRGWPRPV
jgi:hypothetical protein